MGKVKVTKRAWSLPEAARAYRAAKARIEAEEVNLAALKAELLLRIPVGETLEGLQHGTRTTFKADADKLRDLGRLTEVMSMQIDNEKVKALIKLAPEVLEAGAVKAIVSDTLIDKGEGQ